MASLHKDSKSPNYSIRFRYEGRNVNRSLGSSDRRKASGLCARVSETLSLLQSDRIEIPQGVGPIEFILSDGKTTAKSSAPKEIGLSHFFAIYQERLPAGRKEASTLQGEESRY